MAYIAGHGLAAGSMPSKFSVTSIQVIMKS